MFRVLADSVEKRWIGCAFLAVIREWSRRAPYNEGFIKALREIPCIVTGIDCYDDDRDQAKDVSSHSYPMNTHYLVFLRLVLLVLAHASRPAMISLLDSNIRCDDWLGIMSTRA